jgi:plastocyanin
MRAPSSSMTSERVVRGIASIGMTLVVVLGSMPSSQAQSAARGTIKGHVKLSGKLPGNPVIRMGMDPKCAQANAGKRVVQEAVAAALDGSLANVFVHLQGTFPATPVPAEPVVIDQRACVYVPRMVGARVGQTLQVKNSDDLLHNVHGLSAKNNSFNISEPKAGMVQNFKLKDEEVMLRIKCDVHSWMTTYVGIVTNPYFAVTGEGGTFQIPNVPAGTYTILTWHERYGPQMQSVRVRAGATTTVDFVYTGDEKPAK